MAVIIFAGIVLTLLFLKNILSIPKVDKCDKLRDVVQSLNYGRAYPYYTGMQLKKLEKIVKSSNADTTHFENALQLYTLIGVTPHIEVPINPNPYIERVFISFSRYNVVSSITLDIKDFERNKGELTELMMRKFGNRISACGQFLIWRNGFMVINVDMENRSISVIDESLMSKH